MEVINLSAEQLPARLQQLPDKPKQLFIYAGNLEALDAKRILAVAGTRSPTFLAENLCKEVVAWAKDLDIVLVTGLAYGVDQMINTLAIEAGVKTIGVMAQALPESRNLNGLQRRMVELGGALISEVDKEIGWGKFLYIKRNRIIAGLADATLIVQAKRPSGSLHTAEFAMDYNREVFTYPGLPLMPEYAGNNWLIKSQKAQAIEHIYELGVALNWADARNLAAKLVTSFNLEAPFKDYFPAHTVKVYNILRERPLATSAIYDIMQVDSRQVEEAITFLMILRLIRRNIKGFYEISNSRIARKG